MPAAYLSAGDDLAAGIVTTGNTDPITIASVIWLPETTNSADATKVYNFEVAQTHTYFVGNVDGGVLLHNDCTAGVQGS